MPKRSPGPYREFGAALREARRTAPGAPSQETVATRLRELGVSLNRTSISSWENGHHLPEMANMYGMARVVGWPETTVHTLFVQWTRLTLGRDMGDQTEGELARVLAAEVSA